MTKEQKIVNPYITGIVIIVVIGVMVGLFEIYYTSFLEKTNTNLEKTQKPAQTHTKYDDFYDPEMEQIEAPKYQNPTL